MSKKYEQLSKAIRKNVMDLAGNLDHVFLLAKEGEFNQSETVDLLNWAASILQADIDSLYNFMEASYGKRKRG